MIRQTLRRLAEDLFEIKAVEFKSCPNEGFEFHLHQKYPKTPLSPVYFNFRTKENATKPGPLTSELVYRIAEHFKKLLAEANVRFDKIAGVPRAGVPLAASLARMFGEAPLVLQKSEPPNSPGFTLVKKNIPLTNVQLLLVENVITHGSSTIQAAKTLLLNGCLIFDVCTIVDWNVGATECFKKHQPGPIKLHSLFTAADLFEFYESKGWLPPPVRERGLAFMNYIKRLSA